LNQSPPLDGTWVSLSLPWYVYSPLDLQVRQIFKPINSKFSPGSHLGPSHRTAKECYVGFDNQGLRHSWKLWLFATGPSVGSCRQRKKTCTSHTSFRGTGNPCLITQVLHCVALHICHVIKPRQCVALHICHTSRYGYPLLDYSGPTVRCVTHFSPLVSAMRYIFVTRWEFHFPEKAALPEFSSFSCLACGLKVIETTGCFGSQHELMVKDELISSIRKSKTVRAPTVREHPGNIRGTFREHSIFFTVYSSNYQFPPISKRPIAGAGVIYAIKQRRRSRHHTYSHYLTYSNIKTIYSFADLLIYLLFLFTLTINFL
jgi:hypothetical protein